MIKYLTKQISSLSLCARVGLLVGAITGLAISLLDFFKGGIVLSNEDALYIALAMAFFSWLFLLFFMGIVFRYSFKFFTIPSLINSLIISFVTTFLTKYLDSYPLAWLIGMLLGILIGTLLCRINAMFNIKQ